MNANKSVVPWDDCGSYFRISVTYKADGIEAEHRTMQELKRRLSGLS